MESNKEENKDTRMEMKTLKDFIPAWRKFLEGFEIENPKVSGGLLDVVTAYLRSHGKLRSTLNRQ